MAATAKAVLACSIFLQLHVAASAHPMPNTVIDVAATDRGVRMIIAVPVSDLRLALPTVFVGDAVFASASSRQALAAYFNSHLSVFSNRGETQAYAIESMKVTESSDPNVGTYQELVLAVWIPSEAEFDPARFTLQYDAIIHQVPNHFAVVRTGGDAVHARELGVIAFDFSRNMTRAIDIRLTEHHVDATAGAGAMWTAFIAVATGFGYFMVRRRSISTLVRRCASGCATLLQRMRSGAVAANSPQ